MLPYRQWFLLLTLLSPTLAIGQSANQERANPSDISAIRAEMEQLRADYETRIANLEQRLLAAEQRGNRATKLADQALEATEELASAPQSMPPSALSDQNPGIGVVLIGTYADLSQRDGYTIPGFQLGPEAGPGTQGLSLGESEINLKSNVDDKFFANLTLAVGSDNGEATLELEEAYIQSLSLPHHTTATLGRFFSSIGYLNSFHTHALAFIDRPLPYQAFLGDQYLDDGIRLSWLVPTANYVEMGAELLRGDQFPAGGAQHNGRGVWSVFAKLGGDFNTSTAWKAGASYLNATVADRNPGDVDIFSGTSTLTGVEFVIKWAPQGNPVVTNFQLQGEYFQRDEDGEYASASYTGKQSGWYLQGVYQFAPGWRVGYRHAALHADNIALADSLLDATGTSPANDSLMLSWRNSEFSQFKLQYNHAAGDLATGHQLYMQYIMSIGAHGAHQF